MYINRNKHNFWSYIFDFKSPIETEPSFIFIVFHCFILQFVRSFHSLIRKGIIMLFDGGMNSIKNVVGIFFILIFHSIILSFDLYLCFFIFTISLLLIPSILLFLSVILTLNLLMFIIHIHIHHQFSLSNNKPSQSCHYHFCLS